jgi:hypothetical protein
VLSFETHAGIQERLAGWLEQNYKKQFPEMQNFKIRQIRSRTLNANQVEARVKTEYHLSTDNPEIFSKHQSELHLKLERVVDQERSLVEKWKVSAMKTLEEAIEFADEIVIGPSERSESGESNDEVDNESAGPLLEKPDEKTDQN